MATKQFILLALASLFSIFQNNICMEQISKSKVPHSEGKKSEIQTKKQKVSFDTESRESENIVDQGFPQFNYLSPEIRFLVFFCGLENIIRNNLILAPLEDVKEFLDSLSLVNLESHAIAADLGWNNKLSGKNTEPVYKLLVKYFWMPQNLLDQLIPKEATGKMQGYLNVYLGSLLSQDYINKMDNIKTSFQNQVSLTKSQSNLLSQIVAYQSKMPLFSYDSVDEQIIIAARLLIAGANPDLKMSKGEPLLMFIINSSQFHCLIPLLLLRKVDVTATNVDRETALMKAIYYPQILKMILGYDKKGINDVNKFRDSVLDLAICEMEVESVEILLEYGANFDNAFRLIITRYGDCKLFEELEMQADDKDILMMDLLVQYGADVDNSLEIPSEWLSIISDLRDNLCNSNMQFKI